MGFRLEKEFKGELHKFSCLRFIINYQNYDFKNLFWDRFVF